MPFFTLQISAGGPILTAYVGVSQARAAALTAAGVPIPQGVQIRGLVDTGASVTCVDPSVIQSLNLSPTGTVPLNTPTTGHTPHNAYQYDVSLLMPGALPTHTPLLIPNIAIVGAVLLQAQGFHALIGRDVLSECLFSYNGQSGLFSIAY